MFLPVSWIFPKNIDDHNISNCWFFIKLCRHTTYFYKVIISLNVTDCFLLCVRIMSVYTPSLTVSICFKTSICNRSENRPIYLSVKTEIIILSSLCRILSETSRHFFRIPPSLYKKVSVVGKAISRWMFLSDYTNPDRKKRNSGNVVSEWIHIWFLHTLHATRTYNAVHRKLSSTTSAIWLQHVCLTASPSFHLHKILTYSHIMRMYTYVFNPTEYP